MGTVVQPPRSGHGVIKNRGFVSGQIAGQVEERGRERRAGLEVVVQSAQRLVEPPVADVVAIVVPQFGAVSFFSGIWPWMAMHEVVMTMF